jgi:hypothetical protein
MDYDTWKRIATEMNIPNVSLTGLVKGDFFVSKKGTKMFRVKTYGKHILLRDNWGGEFGDIWGDRLPKEDALFYHHVNGCGFDGYDYAIYPRDWKRSVSVDDL